MMWCHLQLVFCVLTVAAESGSRKRPHDTPKASGSKKRPHLDIPECEPGPSWRVVGGARQPCTTKAPSPSTKEIMFKPPAPPPSPLRKFANLFKGRFGIRRRIGGPIRLMDGTEVEVVDSLEDDERGITFLRNLFTDGIRTSSMNLKLPSRLVPSQLNSTEWDPDHDSLVFVGYTITMIEKMFAYGIAEMSENAAAKVLSIGLGGGYINSYLHRNYRGMNITVVEIEEVMLNISRTWFGLNLDNRHRVIIRDGVEYVREAASAHETFDVIFLDACTMDRNTPVNCPSNSFLNLDVVQSFHTLLGARGILVINVMSLTAQYSAAVRMVKNAFQKSFKKCTGKLAPFGAMMSMVMICAEFDPPSGLREQYQRWKNYTTAF